MCLTRDEKKRIPKHKLMKMKESARAKGDCIICFEKGHTAKDCSQRMSDEDKKALDELPFYKALFNLSIHGFFLFIPL